MPEVICPQCKNVINDDEALLCHFCGGSLDRASASFLGRLRSGGMKWVLITLAAIIALVLIMLQIM